MNTHSPKQSGPDDAAAEVPAEAVAAADCFYAGDLAKAIELAEVSIAKAPCPEAFGIIAGARGARGERRQELLAYRRGLALFPNHHVLAVNFARCLRQIPGRGAEAAKILKDVIARSPDFAPARLTLIETLRTATHQLDLAEAEARAYIAHFPMEPDGHLALALTLFNSGTLRGAIDAADRCIAMNGNGVRAWEIKANVFAALGSASETLACYREILAIQPDADIHSRVLMAMQYCDTVTENEILAETNLWAATHTAHIVPRSRWPLLRFDPEKPLTLGIMSRDFRRCSTLYLAQPLLENLPAAWTVIFYANVEYADGDTEVFRSMCDGWVDLSTSGDEEAVDRMTADGIDVLIDINGHTLGGRPCVLAHKPAPVQLEWLDYVGTTGLATMDAIIADAGHIPMAEQDRYREPIRHVSHNLYRYAPHPDAPAVRPLPAAQNGFITFGCFNSPYKLSATTISIWSDLLRALPSACLILNAAEYVHSDTRQRFLTLFAACGVESHRIDFRNGAPDPVGMLQGYGDVDIALDPMPYSGGLTTLEALYMGVPVVTMPGRRFGSRHSSVHLRCIGLDDWIAADLGSYVTLAARKAEDISALERLRAGLRDRLERSPIMDGRALASDMVDIIRDLWTNACRRESDCISYQ